MKARLAVLVVLLVAAIGGYVAWSKWFSADPNEPVFKGVPLRIWVKQLESASEQKRQEAIVAVSSMGEAAKEAVPALIDILERGTPAERDKAVNALANIGPEARAAVPQLVALLPKVTERNFESVARALTVFGDDARPAGPALLAALMADDPGQRENAARALAAIGPSVLPEVTQALRHKDRWMRLRAASVLGMMKGRAAPALPDLQNLSKDPDEYVREIAAESIRRIEADAGAN